MSSVADQAVTMLHLVHQSLSESPALQDCLSAITPGSGVLLIQNAVYEATADELFKHHDAVRFYALKADLQARGIDESRLSGLLQVIDYEGFVDLVERHNPIQSWF